MGPSLHPMPGKTGTGSIVTALAGLFFPARCRICDEILDGISRVPVCATCWNKLTPLPTSGVCRTCGLPGPPQLTEYQCELCVEHPPRYAMARSFGEYGGALRDLLHLLKYDHMEPIANVLGEKLASVCGEEFARCQVIVAVPLESVRQRERGYNQAERIASSVARRLELPVTLALKRVRATTPQAGLSRQERRENVRDAFTAERKMVADRVVLLIDDVMTTGATLDSCAQALRAAGAREVLALTVARTPRLEVS